MMEFSEENQGLLPELWLIIFSFLSTKDKLSVGLACKFFSKLMRTISPPWGLIKVPSVWASAEVNPSDRKKLRKIVEIGVPPEFRPNLWLKLVDYSLLSPKCRQVRILKLICIDRRP